MTQTRCDRCDAYGYHEAWCSSIIGGLAGSGPLSNGVPRAVGDKGESEREMPDPPKHSRRILPADPDDTLPMRKP